jgi:hypothetical protein
MIKAWVFLWQNFSIWQQKKKVATSTKDVFGKNLVKSPYVKEKKLKLHYLDCVLASR